MAKLKELLDKFNADIKLDEKVLNYEGMDKLGLGLDNFNEYHTEKSDGDEIHVFSGVTDSINFEYIINPKDSGHDGNPSATYLVLDDQGVAGTYYKEIFNADEDIITVEQM